jgi:hypothetical protein
MYLYLKKKTYNLIKFFHLSIKSTILESDNHQHLL